MRLLWRIKVGECRGLSHSLLSKRRGIMSTRSGIESQVKARNAVRILESGIGMGSREEVEEGRWGGKDTARLHYLGVPCFYFSEYP
jgi:hypothetical protein